LLPVEVMASVLVGVWLTGLSKPAGASLRFERTLLVFIGLSLVSLVTGYLWVDPAIDAARLKLAVSIGQVLLIVWPVGTCIVISRSIHDARTVDRILDVITWCAVPSLVYPFVPESARPYLSWSVYFGLAAGPFCVARACYEPALVRRVGLWLIALAPLVNGIINGKAFLYGFALASVGAITVIRGRRLLIAVATAAFGIYLLGAAASGTLVPGPLQRLVAVEEAQGSWGGRSGRVALALDTIAIWAGHPMFGVGPGNNWPYMNHYSVIDTPHNQYLQVLLDEGAVGLACLLVFILQAYRAGWSLYRRATDLRIQRLALGWLGYFTGMVLGCITGDFMFHSIRNGGLMLFSGFYLQWVLLGLLIALVRCNQAQEDELAEDAA
jgi:O-antigen ligase